MSIIVVGSVAYDTIIAPSGSRSDALGGSATYFSVSCSYFTPVTIVAIVGEDFDSKHINLLQEHGVDTTGIAYKTGKTFRWSGEYDSNDINIRTTLDTQLNVLEAFDPSLTQQQSQIPYLFLANGDPEMQHSVLSQMNPRPRLVCLDSMNFWIELKNNSLLKILSEIDVLFMDEGEARELSGENNLVKAARKMMSYGLQAVVIKRGENGLTMLHKDSLFASPAMPLENVVDPTGAGDSFAGGFMGYLAACGNSSINDFRRAAVMGTVMGSFAVESFSLDRLTSLTKEEIEARFKEFTALSRFPSIEDGGPIPWSTPI